MKKKLIIILFITLLFFSGCMSEEQEQCYEETGKNICDEYNYTYKRISNKIDISTNVANNVYAYCEIEWTRASGSLIKYYLFTEKEKEDCNNL